ncbi:hypothetical protein GEMRC1_006509 [Eukaryota sp. GEM-RC1]
MNILIFDEIHNRDVEGDICLTLCKFLLRKDPSVRIVLMSATIPSDYFESLFNESILSDVSPSPTVFNSESFEILNYYSSVPFKISTRISIPGRRYPIHRYFYDELPCKKPVKFADVTCVGEQARLPNECIDTIPDIVESLVVGNYLKAKLTSANNPRGVKGILVFLSGLSHLLDVKDALEQSSCSHRLTVLLFHSSLPSDENERALQPLSKRGRKNKKVKVILATNIAESALTIP